MQSETQQPRYVISIARFYCGCIYTQGADTILFCPKHRHSRHAGVLTGVERITLPRNFHPSQVTVQRMTMNRYFKDHPEVLENNQHNSYHTTVSTKSPDSTLSDDEPDLTGLCTPCYIQHDQHTSTHIAVCECGDTDCHYRWCGLLTGLHAAWPLHADGSLENLTSIPGYELFQYEEEDHLPPAVKHTLQQTAARTAAKIQSEAIRVIQGRTTNQEDHLIQGPYLGPAYRNLIRAETQARRNSALRSLEQKLTRLHVTGAWPPSQHREMSLQLELQIP